MFLTRSESLERIRSRMFPCIWVGRLTNCNRLNLKTISQKRFEDTNCPVSDSQLISGRLKSPRRIILLLSARRLFK